MASRPSTLFQQRLCLEEHPVHAIAAAATVEGCLEQHNSKFKASNVPAFSAGLLQAVTVTLENITTEHNYDLTNSDTDAGQC
ncbi:hypothetical protein D0Z07_9218 [Hyphodiscus hymeniophilus]|uniref:Uncharacterized protein n=1 Tax=Hyphodiscus hymeniophilus TaxID=353542 RepID=A0A9P6SL48_9HELO|nr:hypothetical protein D0Z07_9218 [Hyphodiscus hymeniophilus]